MTGFRHRTFRHCCKQTGCYIDQLPSWDYLDGVFPRNILPTDVDGMVELGGSLLFLEEKRAGIGPPPGQHKAFLELSKREKTTVALTRPGRLGSGIEFQLLVLQNGIGSGWNDLTRDEYRIWLEQWAAKAERQS